MIHMPATDALRRIQRIALGDFVYRSALKYPDRPAIVDGDIRLNYAELDARSSRFAHYLLQHVGGDGQIGMLCANSADMVVAYNGIHKSGNVWVPVNIKLDIRTIEYVLTHAEVSAVVIDEELYAAPGFSDLLTRLGVQIILVRHGAAAPAGKVCTLAQAEAGQPDTLPEVDIQADQPALVMYTSGTTGNPKAAVHSHLSVAIAVFGDVIAMEFRNTDVLGGWMPLFHCGQHSLAAAICAVGGCMAVVRGFVPKEIIDVVMREKVSIFFGLPLMYAGPLADPDFKPASLRLCVYAGAPIPATLIKEIAARMSDNVMLATGQTEMYPGTMSFQPLKNPGRDANYWGTSMIHCETAIMDDAGNLLGRNEVGEIVHRGANVMLGYFKDPEATAEAQKFGWHHTGDLGMWDEDGQMIFLDRKKDMVKTGGENVPSVKVEAVLLSHPGVANVAVVGLPHPHWGEAIAAFIVCKPGADCTEEALLAHCRAQLGNFELPKLIRFIDSLPTTSTGKVRKNVVRDEYLKSGEHPW